MASLRLTRQIKSKIREKANALFYKRISKATKGLRLDFWDEVTQQVFDDHYKKYLDWEVPADWIINFNQISVTLNKQTSPLIVLNNKYKMINIASLFYGTVALKIQGNQIAESLRQEYVKHLTKIESLNAERNEFIEELNTVLGNCNTLTQFLKIWPQGEHLIEDMDLTPTVRTRKKREVTIDETTLQKLNTGLLKQTMLNS